MIFVRGTVLSLQQKQEVSKIFSESFYQWFKYFSKDTNRLAKAFDGSFIWEKFYFSLIDGQVCGMAAVTDGISPSIRLSNRKMTRNLGFYKGFLAYFILKHMLQNHKYPFPVSEETLSIEFVAVSEKSRRRGVASNLIQYIIDNSNSQRYILEVADTNLPAVSAYEKMGFEVFYSVPETHPKQSGINNYLYMEFVKNKQ